MIKDDYRTEMNKDVYAESNGRRGLEEHSIGTYSDDYVKWLESKVKNLTIPVASKQSELLSKFYFHLCSWAVIDDEYRTKDDANEFISKFTL